MEDQELNEAEDKIIELEMQLRMSRACTAELRAEVNKVLEVVKEADDYLKTNRLTTIAHGSILHLKFQELLIEAVRPAAPVATKQKWSQTCKGCGAVETWEAKDFFDAADKLPSGWSYDQVLKGPVCPKCKV